MRFLLSVCAIMLFTSGPVLAADSISLVLDQKITQHFSDKAHKGGEKLPPVKSEEVKSVVTLADDRFAVKSGDKEEIYDFISRKIISIDHGKKTYETISLYAIPAFKFYEKKNQEVLFLMMPKETGIKMGNVRPFDLESQFGAGKNSTVAASISDKMDGAVRRFSLDGAEVASYSLTDMAVPADRKDEYARYFAHKQSLHPAIVEKALAEGRFLGMLSHSHNSVLPEKVDYTATIEAKAGVAEIVAQAPHDYQRVYASNKRLNDIIRRSMTEKEMSKEEYTATMKSLLDAGDNPGVVMLFMEYTVQHGTEGIENLADFLKAALEADKAKGDRLGYVVAAIRRNPESKEEAERVIAILEEARAQNYTHGYIINVFLGNTYAAMKQGPKGMEMIVEALERNPFLVGAYKDLGDKLMTAYEMPDAWACWDRMREIRPEHMLSGTVTDMETRLVADFPQYF